MEINGITANNQSSINTASGAKVTYEDIESSLFNESDTSKTTNDTPRISDVTLDLGNSETIDGHFDINTVEPADTDDVQDVPSDTDSPEIKGVPIDTDDIEDKLNLTEDEADNYFETEQEIDEVARKIVKEHGGNLEEVKDLVREQVFEQDPEYKKDYEECQKAQQEHDEALARAKKEYNESLYPPGHYTMEFRFQPPFNEEQWENQYRQNNPNYDTLAKSKEEHNPQISLKMPSGILPDIIEGIKEVPEEIIKEINDIIEY